MKNRTATTVKIESTLYDDFKVLGVRHKLTLQNLVERCIYRYVKEDAFKDGINNFFLPIEFEVTSSATSFVSASVKPV